MGAHIEGIGSNIYVIEGGRPLGGAAYTIGPDHIEIGSFIGLAAVTNGEIAIDPVRGEDLRSTLLGFERLGIRPRIDGSRLTVSADQERRIRPDLGGHVPKLEDGPWPAFPADVMSTTIVTATQCSGMLLVFEKMFESRLFFVDKLIGMGARIVLCDPHRAVISGPAPLKGGTVESPDIRAGMAMLLAALAAEGHSTIHNVGQIERGYERIDERLRALGAEIERVDGSATPAPGGPGTGAPPGAEPAGARAGLVAGITGGARPGGASTSGSGPTPGRRGHGPLARFRQPPPEPTPWCWQPGARRRG
jgi:UDP-N-acetylglucosamine 1-carboxyvinyltransferase